MKISHLLLGASAAAGASFLSAPASATPFTVYYDVTDIGGSYQYDIDVVLDNNDGSWSSGQEFDWFSFGNQTDAFEFEGAFSDPVVSGAPAMFSVTESSGGANGPALCVGGCSVGDGGYVPSLNETFSFTIMASTFLGAGELLWSNLSATGGNSSSFNIAVLGDPVSEVPLPAGALLFLTGLGGAAAAGRKRASAS